MHFILFQLVFFLHVHDRVCFIMALKKAYCVPVFKHVDWR